MIIVDIHHADGPQPIDCMPAALAAIRRYFMDGGKKPCRVQYDGLDMVVSLRDGWDTALLP